MRKPGMVVLALAVLIGACHTGAPRAPQPMPTPFAGTWRFVSGTYTQPDGRVSGTDSTQTQLLKVIGPTHFAYVTQWSGAFLRAGAGRYRFDDTTYTEQLDLASADDMRAKTYTFRYRVEGDTWYQDGSVNGVTLSEVYRRVR